MRRILVTGLLVLTVVFGPSAEAVGAAATPSAPPDTFVSEWDEVGSSAFTAAARSSPADFTPAEGHILFTYLSIAVYDAVMAVERDYEPFAVRVRARRGASAEAAVAAAAYGILSKHLSGQQATLDAAYDSSLARIADGRSKTRGIAVGRKVAAQLIEQRADDGFLLHQPYPVADSPLPGVWQPTSPTRPIGTYLGSMTPFAVPSATFIRLPGPPELHTRSWAREYNEVKAVGSSTSTLRTAEQTEAARFWGEPPVQQARASFRRFIADHELGISEAARFMAMVSVTYGDAFISCFQAKYDHAFWRPVTAVHAGDTDGNDATVGDPAWLPLLPGTPNHPEYPSAHACITPAAGIVASRFLGTRRIDFTVPSVVPGGTERTFRTAKDLEREVARARIWGGIHFRSAVEDGSVIAKRTAHYVLAHHFQARR